MEKQNAAQWDNHCQSGVLKIGASYIASGPEVPEMVHLFLN